MRNRKSGLCWLWIAAVVLLLDRITKFYAKKYLAFQLPIAVFPGFNLTLAYNKGAAFSLLNSASGWQTWMFGGLAVVVTIGIFVWLSRLSSEQRWLAIALTFVMGGALGNVIDRMAYGHVIDFLDVYAYGWHWPTFNVADSAICVGAVMLFLDAMVFKKN